MTCNACGRKSCYTHGTEWHEGLTCAEMDNKVAKLRGKEIRANEKYIAKKTKPCPNKKCGKPIQKRGGCQHMTCKSFSWFRAPTRSSVACVLDSSHRYFLAHI